MVERYRDRKSTRLNSSHVEISYAVFCLKKKKKNHRLDDHLRKTQIIAPLHVRLEVEPHLEVARANENGIGPELHHERRFVFFFNDTATTEIYTLSLHDALPIFYYSKSQVLPAPPGSCQSCDCE